METPERNTPSEQILAEVARLSLPELEQLTDRVLVLRAERRAPHMSGDEAALLSRINRALPGEKKEGLRALLTGREAGDLSAAQYERLAELTDELEMLQADRLAALSELARLRGATLQDVMRQLGISFPDHD
jgi:hypothetical protein